MPFCQVLAFVMLLSCLWWSADLAQIYIRTHSRYVGVVGISTAEALHSRKVMCARRHFNCCFLFGECWGVQAARSIIAPASLLLTLFKQPRCVAMSQVVVLRHCQNRQWLFMPCCFAAASFVCHTGTQLLAVSS